MQCWEGHSAGEPELEPERPAAAAASSSARSRALSDRLDSVATTAATCPCSPGSVSCRPPPVAATWTESPAPAAMFPSWIGGFPAVRRFLYHWWALLSLNADTSSHPCQ